jgi:hypothetical protein
MLIINLHFLYTCNELSCKCTWTGSACPVCLTPFNSLGVEPNTAPQYRSYLLSQLRNTSHEVVMRMSSIQRSCSDFLTRASQRGRATVALKLGVNLEFDNPWHIAKPEEWVFGPDPSEDNICRCLLQVTLHGMDEGSKQKSNRGILLYALAETGLPPIPTDSILQIVVQMYIVSFNFMSSFDVHLYNLHFCMV